MTTLNFELTAEARTQWTEWLQAGLHRANATQKEVAIEINGNRGDGSAKRSEVNRFVKGYADALRRWFTQRTEWLEIFARIAQIKTSDLREKLVLVGSGEAGFEAAWHRAFPDVLLADVEIEAAVEGSRGETLERVIEEVVRHLGDPERWNDRKTPAHVALIAPPGRAREIAAKQIQAQLRRQLDQARAKALSALEERQKTRASSPKKSVEVPELRVEILPAPIRQDAQGLAVGVVVMDDAQAREIVNTTPHALRLIPWGPRQAIELALRLAEVLPSSGRRALRDFAQRVEQLPAIVGREATPHLVIQLLAEVVRRGCPKTVPEARDLLARAAWDQASVRCGDALDAFDERLMCHFMAALATRERTNADDVRSWTHIPRAVALDALRSSLRRLLGPAAGRPLADLLTHVETAKGSERQAAIDAFKVTLASEPCEDILAALVAGGVFVEDAAYAGPCVRVVEPSVAAIWAARGLGGLPAFDEDWQRLLDPDWLPVLDELCRRGLGHDVLQARLAGSPEALSLDAAAWTVRMASHTTTPIAVVKPAWAAMVWAQAHGMYLWSTSWGTSAWGAWVPQVLRQISMDYRRELPIFEADPIREFEALVPEEAKILVARWRRTSSSTKRHLPDVERWGWHLFAGAPDRATLARTICDLCPGQIVPLHPWSFAWSDGHKLDQGLIRLMEVASAGDSRAIQLLDGRAWLEAQQAEMTRGPRAMDERRQVPIAIQIWRHLPADGLLLWAVRAGHSGAAAAQVLVNLAARIGPSPLGENLGGLFVLAEQAGTEKVEWLCAHSLLVRDDYFGHRLHPELAIAIAGHMGLRELLREVVCQPANLLPECRLYVRQGMIRLDQPWAHELLQLRSDTNGRGYPRGARINVEERVDSLEQRAHAAAVQLYRMGDKDELLERWRVGPTHLLQLPLWKDRRRAEGLFSLIADGFPSPYFPTDNLLAFCEYRCDDLSLFRQSSKATSILQILTISLRSRLSFFGTLRELEGELRPEVLTMADGVLALLDELPDVVSPEVERILSGAIPMIRPADTEDGLRALLQWRSTAAAALIELGDDAPLRGWVCAQGSRERMREHDVTVGAVDAWLRRSVDHLDRIWTIVRDEVTNGRLTGSEREQLEWRLLCEGSARDAKGHNILAPADGLERPRPYVVSEALRTTSEEFWMRLYHHNSHHADWTPVIRQELSQSTDARTRAALALDLSRHNADTKELIEALRYWALEDPSPFLGGPNFDWRARRAVGGVSPLLTSLCSSNVPWIKDALVRLWRIAVQLPIADRQPRYETWRWDEAPPAELLVLFDHGSQCPSPLAELANQLEARGLGAEILRTFDHPPEVPPPEKSQLVAASDSSVQDRPAHLRAWLRPWWLRLAPDTALHAALTADPNSLPLDVLDQLVARRFRGLESVCTSFASHSIMFVLRPMLETAPAAAADVVATRVAAPIAPIRMELATALAASVAAEFRHLGVLRLLRGAVGQLDVAADVPTPGGGGDGPDDPLLPIPT